MPVSPDPGQLDAPADLITLLQDLPSCRMRRGVRYPQGWYPFRGRDAHRANPPLIAQF